MRPCRECGREVSTSAKTCPGCGTQWPANKAALTATGCALIFGLLWVPLVVGFCALMVL
jgi:hypothetical protein